MIHRRKRSIFTPSPSIMRLLYLSSLALAALALAQTTNDARQCETSRYDYRHRVFVATDMSNEPDDQMSLVRFLTYANEFDIQGIAGSTSIHKNDSVDETTIREVISTYGNVTVNLNAHVPSSAPYPSGAELLSKVTIGHPVYGLEALKLNLSNAAAAFVDAVDNSPEPTWFLAWGGTSILAESLNHISSTRNASAIADFISKLRVYTISDQDDAGPWLRLHYPQLFYIVSIHAMQDYARATWNGISGEIFRPADRGGPNSSLVTNEWLDEHIRNVGELGKHYPYYDFIMEGDTPSFFPLIKNGLGDPEHPEWGNWGGRYKLIDRSGKNSRVYSDATDFAEGVDGEGHLSNHASIWRWRQAYQFDFANRMQWTLDSNYSQHNHAPIAIVNGQCDGILQLDYRLNDTVSLDASQSWDPDNDELTFEWFHYRDVVQEMSGAVTKSVVSKNVTITPLNEEGSVVDVTPLANLTMHIILTVTDKRDMGVATYRRVILKPLA